MKEVGLIFAMFFGALAFVTLIVLSAFGTRSLFNKSENLSPTEEVSGVIMQGWDVIKGSDHPSSRIVIQCTDGQCTGHWEPNH